LAGEVGDQMSIIQKISVESGYLHVSAMGDFSLVEAKRAFIEMLEAAVLNKVTKVLLDGREVAGDPEVMERFYYGVFAAESVVGLRVRGVCPSLKFAYVLEVPMLDPNRFGETVAVNRGMLVKVFDNVVDALRWLGIAPANNPDAGDGT